VPAKSYEEVCEAILALFPPFSEVEERVALALYRLLANGGPVSIGELAHATGASPADTERMLAGWPGVYRADDGRIIGYGGLSVAETRHRMHIAFWATLVSAKALILFPFVYAHFAA
jgi:alkylmercury lyase-like protein